MEHNALRRIKGEAFLYNECRFCGAHLFLRLVLNTSVAPFASGRTVVKTQQQMTVCRANLMLTGSCQG